MSRNLSLLRSLAVVNALGFALAATTADAGAITVVNGTITSGTNQYAAVSGTSANGTSWASLVTGTSPVAYFDLGTGTLMFDPKGRDVNAVDFRWGTVGTITATTAGPYVFTTGSAQNAVSTSSIEKTLPAGTWSAVTTFPARLSANVSLTNSPTLATSGGNIASTTGWFNQPWSFGAIAPSVTTEAQMYSSTAGQGFRSLTAGGNLLGYGSGIGMFLYVQSPSAGNQYGAVVPVQAVPEPSTLVLAGVAIAAVGFGQARRRRKLKAAAAAIAA